jgi:hypothetical protein
MFLSIFFYCNTGMEELQQQYRVLQLENAVLTRALEEAQQELQLYCNLKREHEALKESFHAQLYKMSSFAEQEFDRQKRLQEQQQPLSVVPNGDGDPALAARMLRQNNALYMHGCRSLEDKKELWRLVLESGHTESIMAVAEFLYHTLNDEMFGQMVMYGATTGTNDKRVPRQFLKVIRARSRTEHDMLCKQYGQWECLVKSRFKQALEDDHRGNRRVKLARLEKVLALAQQHPSDDMDWLVERLHDAIRDARVAAGHEVSQWY